MKGRHHRALVEQARGLDPIRTAVVHPVDTVSLLGAIEAAKEKLIIPVLVGPEAKIRPQPNRLSSTFLPMSSCRRSTAARQRRKRSHWHATARWKR